MAQLLLRFLLATLGSLLSTTAAFLAGDRGFRLLMMVSSVVWIGHNVLAWTPAAIALETVFLGSNIVGYYRHYLRGGGVSYRVLKEQDD